MSIKKKTDERLDKVFEYISDYEELEQKIFYDGQIYDAFSIMVSLIQKAKKSLSLVDGYIDIKTLNLLSTIVSS